ncbi:MGMT family protein [Granulicella aggregans]|uniref:MGMT family protein n=1 Tax=Granulicella aggregans TaxID=474949 RepID=UPI0021DF8A40|nr:MGMT family protein [Granulicella aggregans]
MKETKRRTPTKGSRILITTLHGHGEKPRRSIYQEGLPDEGDRDRAFRRVILSIPPGKVSTYGKVAAAAGYPLYHRAVARLLRTDPPDQLPWHRVLGAGGEIKLPGTAAKEQKGRLRLEGVQFRGDRVDMDLHEHALRVWEIPD